MSTVANTAAKPKEESFLRRWFPKTKASMDYPLLAVALLLTIVGMVVLFSASYAYGQTKFGDGYYYVRAQLRGLVSGLAAMLVLSRLDYRRLMDGRARVILYVSAVALLLLCFVPGIGTTEGVNNAQRWIQWPMNFQPSEYSKFAILIVIAAVLSSQPPGTLRKNPWPTLFISILLLGLILFILAKQPNYSILMITTMSVAVMLLVAGLRWGDALLLAVALGVPLVVNMYGADYRVNRLTSFWAPFAEENIITGSQLRDSLYALGSGGIWGTGLGKSRMKFDFLSYGESDFILSIIGEEFGLVGLLVLLLLYMLLIYRGLKIAQRAATRFGMLMASGITALIGIQTFVHILVGTGLLPTTGVTLPFISHGSSSLMCFLAAVGLLLSVSRDRAPAVRRAKPPEMELLAEDLVETAPFEADDLNVDW